MMVAESQWGDNRRLGEGRDGKGVVIMSNR